ncbi:MAG: amidase [Bacteroidota bacterium]
MNRRSFVVDSSKILIGLGLYELMACQAPTQPSRQTDISFFPYEEMSIQEMQEGYETRKFSISEVVQAYLDRIEEIDQNGPTLNSIIEVNPDALSIAQELEREFKSGNWRGPMHGIPVLLKDNIDTHDQMSTTAGSRALAGSKPLQDSWVAQRLRAAGAVILGKANLSEWANFRGDMSSSGWSGLGGQTKNPYRLDRNPCGSSAGSGASVSANLCMIAIGTETNGSIVCPSNNNGVVGIKPTVGLVGRSGIIPISATQDTAGPMARTVRDAATCLGSLVGIDPRDAQTSISHGHSHSDYTQFLKEDGLDGKKLGLYTRAMGFHHKVDPLVHKAIELLTHKGAEVIEIDRINTGHLGRGPFDVLLYEFKDGLNQYFASLGPNAPIKSLAELIEFNKKDSVELKYFDQHLLELAQEKEDLSEPTYQKALEKMLKAYREDGIDRVMNEHELDALIAPTGSPAWKTDLVNGDNHLGGSSTPAARSGYPNITVPMGFVEGLPVGLSFFGKAWSEPLLLEIAYSYEQASMHRRSPRFLEE